MDVKSKEDRSKNMAAIKAKNTKPEIMLRKALFKSGLRYRINHKVFGRPDLLFLGKRIAVFIDGCFWHGCPKCYREPDNNKEFWVKKINQNRQRDIEVNKRLSTDGWLVLRFWEHEIKKNLNDVVESIVKHLTDRT